MTAIDIQGIRRLLPHRYPFLLLDHVEHVEAGENVTAIKNITANEPFFQGHFPEYPVFPGVLLVECIAQAAAILASETIGVEASQDTLYLLAGINRARFKRLLYREINCVSLRGLIADRANSGVVQAVFGWGSH